MSTIGRTELIKLVVVLGLALSCGSEGSLASSGSSDWTYEGTGGTSGSSASSGTSSASGGSATGMSSSGSSGAQAQGATATGTTGTTGSMVPATSGAGGDTTAGTGGAAAGTTGNAGSGATPAASAYHQLANWVSPEAGNPNHHGRVYFLGHAHQDENGIECTSCHGNDYEGGAAPACASCHSDWRSDCSFCHGSSSTTVEPPGGIYDEMELTTLAVGRHAEHLSSGDSHLAFACSTCHVVPDENDVDHTLSYSPSDDLSMPGHHGDVTFSASAMGMTFNVDATTGSPVSARGTCVGACHSDGLDGQPASTPYWAGGNWNSGCGNCHSSRPNSGRHGHALDEGATCADCHSGATTNRYAADTHFNNEIDYTGTVAGQGMTLTADSSCQSGVRCNGTCHGENEGHNNRCW